MRQSTIQYSLGLLLTVYIPSLFSLPPQIAWLVGNPPGGSKYYSLALPPKISLPPDGIPFVTLFENDYYKGSHYHHFLKKECTNLPSSYDNWASSVNVYDRCVYLCDQKDCGGGCHRVHGSMIERLHPVGMRHKVSSIKFCYTFAERTFAERRE